MIKVQEGKPHSFWVQYLLLLEIISVSIIVPLLFKSSLEFIIRRIIVNTALLILTIVLVIYPSRLSPKKLFFRRKNAFVAVILGLLSGIIFAIVIFKFSPELKEFLILYKAKYTYWKFPFILLRWLFSFVGVTCLVIAVSEELVFRAIMLPNSIVYFKNKAAGICVTTITFMGFHYGYFLEGKVHTIVVVTIMQIVVCIIFLKLKNILYPIALHYAYNLLLVAIPTFAGVK
jgi:membrane protease YdiL (CAAX protease family)